MKTSDLSECLERLHRDRDEQLRGDYSRSLPFQDGCFDRWERAKRLGFGEGVSIYNSAFVFGDVEVAEYTWIGPNTILDGIGGLQIGRYCSISSGVQIYTHDTVKWALTEGRVAPETAAVDIGDCCYIGSTSVVAKGVTIGDHCVVAANSFVRTNMPAFSIFGGTPARKLGIVTIDGDNVELVFDG